MNSPFSLEGRRYLVTGAASGIGKETAIVLSNLGANLLLADIDEEKLNETVKLCTKEVQTTVLDLAMTEEIYTKIVASCELYGKLNGLVHVAGVPCIAPIKSLSPVKLSRVFSINTFAAVELSKAICNRKVCATNGNSIVFISSVYASVGSPCSSGYAMSKAAIEGLTRSLAMEMAGRKIRVNCVAPGFIKTPMDDAVSKYFDGEHSDLVTALHPLGLGEPNDVAYAVAYLLSDASKWITGTVLHVDGGFTAQ